MEVLVFQYTWPLLVVLLSLVILRERMTLRKIVALVFGCIGVVAVLTKGQLRTIRVDNPGVIALVVLGALSFALFSVLSKKVRKDPLMVTAVYFLVATVASLISMLTFSAWTIPSVEDFPPVLANGILVNGFSYVLWLMALRKADASYVAPFVFVTPVLSAFYLILLFNEPLSPAHGIGLVCIVAAGLINSPGRRDRMS